MRVRGFGILITAAFLIIIGCILGYTHRYSIHNKISQYNLYHELKRFFGLSTKYADGNRGMKYYYNEEVSGRSIDNQLGPKWWFRPSHMGTFCSGGLVDDVDGDGKPEVYVSGGSKFVYCLDGETGAVIWKFELPFSKVGALAAILEDIDGDGKRELIVGTHTDLPLRVYCLSTKKYVRGRILWHTDVHGDFIQGGLVSFRNKQNQVRFIVGTRDAPYSRGTVNVLDNKGRHLYPPIYGVDICNNRPSVADINNDGAMDMVIGSHKFYGAKFGHKVTVFTAETGKLLWSVPVGVDTGALQFPILDVDSDGKYEVCAGGMILNALNGEVAYDFSDDKKFQPAYVLDDKEHGATYIGDKNKIINLRTKETLYEFNEFPRGAPSRFLDLDGDGRTEFMTAYVVLADRPQVRFYLFDALTGTLKDTIRINIDSQAFRLMEEELPSQQELYDFQMLGPTKYDKPGYAEKKVRIKELDKINPLSFMLADTDGDMRWEALVNFNAVFFCFDLPYVIGNKYASFRYRRLSWGAMEDLGSYNYDLSN